MKCGAANRKWLFTLKSLAISRTFTSKKTWWWLPGIWQQVEITCSVDCRCLHGFLTCSSWVRTRNERGNERGSINVWDKTRRINIEGPEFTTQLQRFVIHVDEKLRKVGKNVLSNDAKRFFCLGLFSFESFDETWKRVLHWCEKKRIMRESAMRELNAVAIFL